jgi:dihydrodipicolinate synthase/N-acetylneuraminate lyase
VRAGVFPLAIKAALNMLGVCEPWSASPVQKLDSELESRLREQLAGWGLLM